MSPSDPQRKASAWQTVLAVALLVAGGGLLIVDIPSVVLNWDTASEVGTAGFNVYRASLSDAPDAWVKVNEALIPAAGDELVGAAYRYEDDDLLPGRRYRYRIEEVEWDGDTTQYPDEVVVRAGLPSRWTKVEGGALVVLGGLLLWRQRVRRKSPAA